MFWCGRRFLPHVCRIAVARTIDSGSVISVQHLQDIDRLDSSRNPHEIERKKTTRIEKLATSIASAMRPSVVLKSWGDTSFDVSIFAANNTLCGKYRSSTPALTLVCATEKVIQPIDHPTAGLKWRGTSFAVLILAQKGAVLASYTRL